MQASIDPNKSQTNQTKGIDTYANEHETCLRMEQSALQCIQVAMMMHGQKGGTNNKNKNIKIVFCLRQESTHWLYTRTLFGVPAICNSNKTFPSLCRRVQHFADSCTAIVTCLQPRLALDTLYKVLCMTYPFETEKLGMSWFRNILQYARCPTSTNEATYKQWVDSMCVYILHKVSCCIHTTLDAQDKHYKDAFVIKQY